MPRTHLWLATACLLVAGTNASRADLITNGSFEQAGSNGLPSGSGFQIDPGNATTLPGWQVTGSREDDGVGWIANANPFGPSTPFGNYFVDLTGYSDLSPYFGLSQTVATTPGMAYALTFDLGVDQADSRYNGPIGIRAAAGATTQDFTDFNPAGTGSQWGGFTLDFTAISNSTLISFTGLQAHGTPGSTGGGQYIGLDNVGVNPATVPPPPPTVPEPASLFLLAGGFVGAALARRRRA